jgi:hypothetical protein
MTTPPSFVRCPRGRARAAERGSLLIVTMLLASAIGVSLVSYLNLTRTTLKISTRSFLSNSAINLAEIGLEQALFALNQHQTGGAALATAWSAAAGWTTDTTTHIATATFPTGSPGYFTPAPNAQAVVKVHVRNYDLSGPPRIVAKSVITPGDGGPSLIKYVVIDLARRGLFANGLVARDSVSWNGHPIADSWNSGNPASPTNYSTAIRTANCTVGAVNGRINLGSGGDVYGYTRTGPAGTTSGGSVHGTITTDFNATFPPIVAPSGSTGFYTIGGSTAVPTAFPRSTDTVTAGDGKYYYILGSGKFIDNVNTAVGTAGTPKDVVLIMESHSGSPAITFTGTRALTIATGSSLAVYTNGNISIHGNGLANGGTVGANPCSSLVIYGTHNTPGGQSITVGGNGQLYAAIYAPNATVTLQGGGSAGMVLGSIVANSINMNGGTDFHYDEALATLNSGGGFRVNRWKELQTAEQRNAVAGLFNF